MSEIGVGVVGCGYWGIHHVRVFANQPGAALRGICDRDESARRRGSEWAPGAALVAEYSELLARDDIDAVVIATPGHTHVELTTMALSAGKHVLVEKPLAHSLEEALRVRRAVIESGKVLAVGHLLVYHPAVARVRELLTEGNLGDLLYLYARRVNLGRLRRDENALWSLGPHDVSIIDHLLGEAPVRVQANGAAYLQQGIEDVVFVNLEYASGVRANIHLSWLDPRKERKLTLVCKRKMVEFDDVAPDKLRIYDKGYDTPPSFSGFGEYLTLRQGDVHIPHVSMQEPLGLEASHFLDCIRNGERPVAGIDSGVRVSAVLAAAQRSIEGGGAPVPLDISELEAG